MGYYSFIKSSILKKRVKDFLLKSHLIYTDNYINFFITNQFFVHIFIVYIYLIWWLCIALKKNYYSVDIKIVLWEN